MEPDQSSNRDSVTVSPNSGKDNEQPKRATGKRQILAELNLSFLNASRSVMRAQLLAVEGCPVSA